MIGIYVLHFSLHWDRVLNVIDMENIKTLQNDVLIWLLHKVHYLKHYIMICTFE